MLLLYFLVSITLFLVLFLNRVWYFVHSFFCDSLTILFSYIMLHDIKLPLSETHSLLCHCYYLKPVDSKINIQSILFGYLTIMFKHNLCIIVSSLQMPVAWPYKLSRVMWLKLWLQHAQLLSENWALSYMVINVWWFDQA